MRVFSRSPINLDQVKIPQGQVYLIPERCKGCALCIHFCPRNVLVESTKTNRKGYHYPEVRAGMETGCVHCDFCTLLCPEFAIFTLET